MHLLHQHLYTGAPKASAPCVYPSPRHPVTPSHSFVPSSTLFIMARGTAAMNSTLVANPYPPPKQQMPRVTLCELCDREILTKDFHGHKVSKAHRAAEEKYRQEVEKAKNSTGSGDDSGFHDNTESGGNDTWGSSDATNTGNDGFSTKTSNYKNNNGGDDPTCYGCGMTGHQKRDCPQGSGGQACFNCGEVGHRKMECNAPRKPMGGGGGGSNRLCFNCNKPGHNKAECTEPRTGGGGGGGGRACHNCGGEGHLSRECDKPRVIKCRNCDGEGHPARECDKPRDWGRVQCRNCNNYGHGEKRCPEPAAPPAQDAWGNTGESTDVVSSGNWADDTTAAAATETVSTNW
ncbi:zinc knuckle [Pyrenophora seminiperda CCB06]|uniref:Zinc knuckle n=1 Tax=Pyrenophora seminiperda CCB06 TaxID=1302712 RepID=A0A3M7LZ81_9PLEO|nr:zinc knuckle [Pyrenophora seminiperda CCB06]